MNPICKCCGYYCAFLMIIGLYFFGIMIALEKTGSPYLGDFQLGSKATYEQMRREMGWALLVSLSPSVSYC